jgi:glycosidase
MLEILRLLYPDQCEEVHRRLQELIDEFKEKVPARKDRPLFSEKDIMLICYPDHVRQEGVRTLKTLHNFLKEFAQGTINRVHILPFFPFSSDDGFSVTDYYRVNEPYGDWDDIRSMSEDFQLMFDLVMNHVSAKSEWFSKFLEGDQYFKGFFTSFDREIDTSKVLRPRTNPVLTPFQTSEGKRYVWTIFSPDQVDLNYHNPEVLLQVMRVLLFYVEQGAEAIRLDAPAYQWDDPTTSSFDLPQGHEIVQLMRDVLESVAPGVWLVTETVMPHRQNMSYFGDSHNEAHLVYNFILESLLPHTFLKKDTRKATAWLKQVEAPGAETSFLNLTESHDGIHTVPAKGILTEDEIGDVGTDCAHKGGKVLYRSVPGKQPEPYEFNIAYLDAIGTIEGFLASQAIQLALRGVPLIYFNNFIGVQNWKEGYRRLGYSRAIHRKKFSYAELVDEMQDPDSTKHKVHTGYIRLLQARINEPLFSPLAGQSLLELDARIMAIHRFSDSGSLLALTNVSDSEVDVDPAKVGEIMKKDRATDILTGTEFDLNSLKLSAYQALWLK